MFCFGKKCITLRKKCAMEVIYNPRHIDQQLLEWKASDRHKPLLVRGARQVGKSSSVRALGRTFEYFIDINFEKQPERTKIFNGDIDIPSICNTIARLTNTPIVDGETLLFFDEIQLCKSAISALRYFWEDRPGLHVVAAGSLLEFALQEIPSFGVGRIQSVFMYPLSFDEFLDASGLKMLKEAKNEANAQRPLDELTHAELVKHFRNFTMVGGMPEVVDLWVEKHDFLSCLKLQENIVLAYEDDFGKYRGKINPELLRLCIHSVAHQTGNKFVFSRASAEHKSAQVKEALELLQMAGLILPVYNTSANGLPLGAEANSNWAKYLYLDSGLLLAVLNMSGYDTNELCERILIGDAVDLVNKGSITEMIAGLELVKYTTFTRRAELFYWATTDAEVDYVCPRNGKVLPIEVKAGTRGSMKSLYQFMESKNVALGIRTSLENFGTLRNEGKEINIVPLYALRGI